MSWRAAAVVWFACLVCLGARGADAEEPTSPFRYLRPSVAPEAPSDAGQDATASAPPAAQEGDQGGDGSQSDNSADENAADVGGADDGAPAQEDASRSSSDEAPSPPFDAGNPEVPPGDAQPNVESQDGGAKPGSSPVATPSTAPRLGNSPSALRLGVLAGRDVAATMAALAPVTRALTESLGRPVEMLPMASYGSMVDAQLQRRLDGGFYSAASFALAQANCRCLEPIAAPAAADGTTAYRAIIVARRDRGIAAVSDLKGKSVAIGAADSIGARRMQLAGLLAQGVDPGAQFAAVRQTESAADAVRLLASGAVDAAFAWSSLAGDPERGYSRGTLADLVASGDVKISDLVIVWRSPPIAHSPFAVLKSLQESDKKALQTYFTGLEAAVPAAYDVLSPYYGGGYAAVQAKDYAGLEILATAKVEDVRFPEATDAPAAVAAPVVGATPVAP